MTKRRTRTQKDAGFALIVVLLLVVVMSIMGLSLLQLIQLDLALVGNTRQVFRSREIVDGIIHEMRGDDDVSKNLPSVTNLQWTGYDATGSEFLSPGSGGGSFQATTRFLRFGATIETDIELSVTQVFEIEGEGSTADSIASPSAATRVLAVETSKQQAMPQGKIIPRDIHAR